MLGEIDLNKKPERPQIFLAKPNREIIAKLSEAYNVKYENKLIELSFLEFDIPYEIDVHHQLVRNRNVDLLRERYLLKMVFGKQVEWFIITKINDKMDNEKDVKNVQAFSLAYQLADKMIRGYKVDAKDMRTVLTDVLAETPWGIGTIDADFEVTYRSFDFRSTTVLDAIYKIGETYNAVIEWDTERRLINFIKPELHGRNTGLKVSYGRYLKTMDKESNANEMVTRLVAIGKDGLSINSVNPIGQSFIQDFSYFMYPFERDENRNVIKHSYYMSDSLCHALLDYEELVESRKNDFSNLLKNLEDLQKILSQKEIEMNTLKNQEAQINDIVLAQQFDENMWFEKFIYNGSPITINQRTKRSEYAYVVLCKVSQTPNITIRINGLQKVVQAGKWVVLGKVRNLNTITIDVSGSANNTEVFIQIANITIEEYDTFGNENALIEKYSLDNKQMQIAEKQVEIDNLKAQIKSIEDDIKELRDILAMENNFTQEQLEELSDYIITREFIDENYVDPHDLYEDAKKKFEELRKPQMIIKVDMVNFKEIVEEQGNWDKLVLGDYITIEYERMKTKATAKIIEIIYDFENTNVNLTIANIKDVSDDERKLEKYIYKSIGTTTTVSMEKNKWGKAVTDVSEISQLLDNLWNKITNDVNIANNEYVVNDRRGLTIYDPNDPLRFLRATHGVLALTRSGGLRYETAITPDGILAERLFGKILLTQRVVIGDDDGILEIKGASATITDRCNREVMKFGLIQENPDKFGISLNRYTSDDCDDLNIINKLILDEDDGFKIQRNNGVNFEDIVWLDVNTGYLNAIGAHLKDSFITDGAIVGATLKIGSGNSVFKADYNGIYLGNEAFSLAPFRVDLNGNAYMKSAHIEDSFITDGAIEGATLKIGSGNRVFKADYNGIYLGHDNFALAPFSVDLDGNLKARKAKFYGSSGQVLIDTDAGVIYLDNFDIEGIGRLTAELINADTIVTGDGFINDLVVSKLRTLGSADYNIGQKVNYIDIRENRARWVNATITSKTQARDSKGRLLYWLDGSKKFLTTINTGIPAYEYGVAEDDRLVIDFVDSSEAPPRIKLGIGDGAIPNISGVGYINKPNQMLEFLYYASNYGYERKIQLHDIGLKFFSQNGNFESNAQNYDIISNNGYLKLRHSSGSYIEIAANGDINIHSVGNIRLTGNRIDLN